jgi:flagellar biosynthesis/type III secretory pathway protein FliH
VFVGETGSVEAIKNVVAKAIESLPLTPGMTLHVAAANAEALKGQLPATLRISVDPGLKPGDCRLESDSGGVDARLEVRAHELRQRLLAALLDGRGDAE